MLTTLYRVLLQAGLTNQDIHGIPQVKADSGQLASVMNTLVFPIAGGLCVLFVIIGALRYTLSQGEANNIKQAKEIIIYALVGLVIVASSFAILQIIINVGQG